MHKKTVDENMSAKLITIGWNEKVENAYKRMHLTKIRHLPVTNDAGEIVGILSDRDVQRSMISRIDRSAGHLCADETIEFDPNSTVRDYMSWPVKSVPHATDLRQVAEIMVAEKVSSLLVCRGDTAIGIVTAEDLIQVLIEVLSDPRSPLKFEIDHILEGTFGQLKNALA